MKSELKTDAATNALPSGRDIIRCHFVPPLTRPATTVSLTAGRRLVFEGMRVLIQIDWLLRETRADWNQDRFRRVMRLRAKAAERVRRRWSQWNPPPGVSLGPLRRRYHANLVCYRYGHPRFLAE